VAGAVNPPALDLANEDLLKSHLRSVWLAETGQRLPHAVRDLLDLAQPAAPILSDYAERLNSPLARQRAIQRGQRILQMLKADLAGDFASWYGERWLEDVINSSYQAFEQSFDRWRSLYRATREQMERAYQIVADPLASPQERKAAEQRLQEATTQNKLLLEDTATLNSDFNTYRYLAGQGFLPGYNFPRLPLLAYIPARRQQVGQNSFLSRPRFLGLSEFGPQALIYHEGSTYRVKRAILGLRSEAAGGLEALLPVTRAVNCPNCGYGHFGDEATYERCVSCDAQLASGQRLERLYRIEQVSTQRAQRITSDEEERQRLGYEMLTTYRFDRGKGQPNVRRGRIYEGEEELLELSYAPSATLWRLNLGWRRRRDPSIRGFNINVTTGEWAKDTQPPEDLIEDNGGSEINLQRIVPYVEDTRNILLAFPKVPLSAEGFVSLQYALKRGIETTFQIESSELASEVLPDRNRYRAILFYEAAEGGAGVLTRLLSDAQAMQRVAQAALSLCHFQSKSGYWQGAGDLENLDEDCEAGCYRCLLSYANQTDHSTIDRKQEGMLNLLCRLSRGTLEIQAERQEGSLYDELVGQARSSLEREWLEYLKAHEYNLPDKAQQAIEGHYVQPDFIYSSHFALVFIDGPHHETETQRASDRQKTQELEDAGFLVIRFPKESGTWESIIRQYQSIFGSGGH
jgi:very-short-patch-repair endonuclease